MNQVERNNRTAEDFYDAFAHKLLADFIKGNRRLDAAITFASNGLRTEGRRAVLDLGCGIGWSTFEFARALPEGVIHGLDLSSRLLAVARAMFPEDDRRQYFVADLTSPEWSRQPRPRYDACVMLDVYEHIAAGSRGTFHAALNKVLSDDALVIMTFPTTLHQAYLRCHHPAGLQPVDEDVTLKDVQTFADHLDATITHFEHKTIWFTDDYAHAIFKKNVRRAAPPPAADPLELLPVRARLRHLEKATPVVGDDCVREIRALAPSMLKRLVRLRP